MSTNLAARAAALANQNGGHAMSAATAQAATVAAPAPVETDEPDFEIPEPPEGGPDQVPAHVAWLRVRATVRRIAKSELYNAAGTRYNFRGVDRVMNAFGPVTLLHGVNVLPVKVEASYRDTKTSKGNATRECTVLVTYRIVGPMGDSFEIQAAGESLDAADKGSAKAQSVALRVALLHGGLVPTGDPDPDSQHLERGEAQVRPPASYRDEILHPGTTRQRMAQIRLELRQLRMVGATVANESGADEPLGAMVDRIGFERFAPKPAEQPPAPAEPAHPEGYDPELGVVVPPDAGVMPGDGLFGGAQ